jgi:hypothetical protein
MSEYAICRGGFPFGTSEYAICRGKYTLGSDRFFVTNVPAKLLFNAV